MMFDMPQDGIRTPFLKRKSRSLRQSSLNVVACLTGSIPIIIASISICLRLGISSCGVAVRVKDAHAPPEDLQGRHALRRRGACTQAVLSLASAYKPSKCSCPAADYCRCTKCVAHGAAFSAVSRGNYAPSLLVLRCSAHRALTRQALALYYAYSHCVLLSCSACSFASMFAARLVDSFVASLVAAATSPPPTTSTPPPSTATTASSTSTRHSADTPSRDGRF
jgi:hypothetical protein